MEKSLFLLCWMIWQVHLPAQAKQALFLIAGQSNGVGKGDATLAPVLPEGIAYEYVSNQQHLTPLMDPVGVNELTFEAAASGSAWPAFAKRYYELTGDTVILVAAARGGSSCHPLAELANYGTWATSGKLFGNAVMKTKAAMQQSGLTLSGIIWVQGERDANAINAGQISQRDYQESLSDLILRFRLAFGKEIPVFVSKTGYYKGHEQAGFKQVQAAQEEIVKKIDDVVMVFDGAPAFLDSGKMMDDIHYNQIGLNEMGACIAENVVAYQGVRVASFYPLPVLKKRAIEEFSLRAGLPNFIEKAKAQKELKIAYLGGSITQVGYRYRLQTTGLIRKMFPTNNIVEIAAGIPGTDADLGACRVEDQLLQDPPDLLFIEFAVNGGFPQGVEGIIRKVKKRCPQTDVCLLYAATASQLAAYDSATLLPHIASLEELAQYYQIPSIHMALSAFLLLREDKLTPVGESSSIKPAFTDDGVHPTESGGNLYAAAIGRMLLQAKQQSKHSVSETPVLPAPFFTNNWEDAHWIEPADAGVFSADWRAIPTRGNLKQFSAWFPKMMMSDKAGASFTIAFEGDAIGLFDIGGPEVGQLKILLDGKALKWEQTQGVRYQVSDRGASSINRFNINCNNRYRGQFFMLQTSPGVHVVEFKIDGVIPDKRKILGPAQLQDIDAWSEKYNQRQIYIAKVLVKGKIKKTGALK